MRPTCTHTARLPQVLLVGSYGRPPVQDTAIVDAYRCPQLHTMPPPHWLWSMRRTEPPISVRRFIQTARPQPRSTEFRFIDRRPTITVIGLCPLHTFLYPPRGEGATQFLPMGFPHTVISRNISPQYHGMLHDSLHPQTMIMPALPATINAAGHQTKTTPVTIASIAPSSVAAKTWRLASLILSATPNIA